jgi:hypothetical protein
VGKHEKNWEPPKRPKRRCHDIQMGFQDTEWAWNGFIWLREKVNLGFQKIHKISFLPYDSLSFPSILLCGNIAVLVYN